MDTVGPRWMRIPASPGEHRSPRALSRKISVSGIALPIDVGRRSTSEGERNVDRNASVRPYIRNRSA
jgi:hypothetical protein